MAGIVPPTPPDPAGTGRSPASSGSARHRRSTLQRITTLALVLLALGAVLIAYAQTARLADGANLAEPVGQVIVSGTFDNGRSRAPTGAR